MTLIVCIIFGALVGYVTFQIGELWRIGVEHYDPTE